MVFSIVHPLGNVGLTLASELVTIERSHEILGGTAPERSSGIDVTYQQPLRFPGSVDRQFHEVGALPNAVVVAISQPECTLKCPVFEVFRAVNVHLLPCGKDEIPRMYVFIPEDVRVAKVGDFGRNYRVIGILSERFSVVGTIGKALCLALSGRRVHGNNGAFPKARSVVFVHDCGATEYSSQRIGADSVTLMHPMYKVF